MGNYIPPTAAELDKSWADEYDGGSRETELAQEDVLVECVRVDVREPKGRIGIILTLAEVCEPYREVAVWFNVEPIKGKNVRNECRMGKDSKLANLYRVTIGKKPLRFDRAKQYARRLINKEFYVKPVVKNGRGLESSYIFPVLPIKSKLWGATGKSYQRCNQVKQQTKSLAYGRLENNNSPIAGQLCDKLCTSDLLTEHTGKGVKGISTTTNQLTHNKVPTTNGLELVSAKETKAIGTSKSSRYFREANETELEYYGRVIDESGILG